MPVERSKAVPRPGGPPLPEATGSNVVGGPGAIPVVSQKELAFVVHPQQVVFRNYDPFQKYQQVISFQNQTTVTQDVRVLPPDNRFFSLSAPRGGTHTLKVSAGLSVSYTITFAPEEDRDYAVDLVCVTESHRFVVPVHALSARGTLDLAPSIHFENAPVKYKTEKTLYVRNIGRKVANFTLEATEPWSVSPPLGTLEPNEAMQLSLFFTPPTLARHGGRLTVNYTNGESSTSALTGTVAEISVQLQQSVVKLEPTFISLERQAIVELRNKADINIRCQWKLHSEAGETDPPFQHPVFTVEPIDTECRARGVLQFAVTFNPQMAVAYDAIAYLDVVGRHARLPLHMSSLGLGPRCAFAYDALDIGDVFVNSQHTYEVLLENRGSIDARFSLGRTTGGFSSKFIFTPAAGAIPPGVSQAIRIHFTSDLIGIINETFAFEIKGAKDPELLHVKGRVIGPTFHFDVDELDFGTVPFNFVNQKMFHMVNTSEIPMRYTLRVPQDKTGDGREFTITPSSGVILPRGRQRITMDFVSNTVQEYRYKLVVDVEEVGTKVDSLDLLATCVVPEVSVSKDSIDFGQCFIGFPYRQTVELNNERSLPAKYEFLLPNADDPVHRRIQLDVDAQRGVVNPRCVHKVVITIVAKQVGNCHAPLYINILGSDQPPTPLALSSKVIGPIVAPEPAVLDFGKITVLEEVTRTVQLINKSPIPAEFTVTLRNNSPVFEAVEEQGTLPPGSTTPLQVSALLDEVIKFTDELVISIVNSADIVVKLTASGKGTTVVPTIPLDTVDFGNQFTATPLSRTFALQNKGRKPQQIVWVNDKGTKAQDVVFWIKPDRCVINPKSEAVFTIEGLSRAAGKFTERLSCKQSQTHKVIYHPTIVGTFHTPLLKFQQAGVAFQYVYDRATPANVVQSKPLTVKNISPLVLNFSMKATPPFKLDQAEYELGFGESATVTIQFDASYKGDRLSHVVKGKLAVTYKDHPQKDSVDLVGDVTFPNLHLDTETVDFGCVLNETQRKAYLTVGNRGTVDAVYSWMFDDEPPVVGNPSRGGTIPAAGNAFDVLPIRGHLRPGDSERIEFLYQGQAQRKLRATAICAVEGGPDYRVNLIGEASSIQFKLDKTTLEFGAQPYDKWEEKEMFLLNVSKVPFTFVVDTSMCEALGRVEVQPREGSVKGSERARLVVRFCPRVPDRAEETFLVRVAHFEPQAVKVTGVGQYSSVLLSLPRHNMEVFESFREQAQANLEQSGGRKHWASPDSKPGEAPPAVALEAEMERLYFTRALEEAYRLQRQRSLAKALAARPPPPPAPAELPPVVAVAVDAEEAPSPSPGASPPSTDRSLDPLGGSLSLHLDGYSLSLPYNAPLASSLTATNPSVRDNEPPAPELPTSTPAEAAPEFPLERLAVGKTERLVLARYVCDFGPVVKGESKRRTITVYNDGPTSASFVLDKRIYTNTGISFSQDRFAKLPGHPQCGQGTLECTFDTRGDLPVGPFSLDVPIDLKSGALCMLQLTAEVVVPTVTVSHERLDFGAVRVGQTRVITLQLLNSRALPCDWSAVVKDPKRRPGYGVIWCNPTSGCLAPGATAKLQVSFSPMEGAAVQHALQVVVQHNPRPIVVQCRGTGEDVALRMEPPQLSLGPVLPFSHTDSPFSIVNDGSFAVEVYATAFDKRQVIEAEILRNLDCYVGNVLFLEPREVGEALPENLIEDYYQRLCALDEELLLNSSMEEPPQTPKEPSPSKTVARDADRGAKGPMVVVLGAPLAGKTTLARALAERCRFRLLDLGPVVQAALHNPEGTPQELRLQQWAALAAAGAEGLGPFPDDALATVLGPHLKDPTGCVVDGLPALYPRLPRDAVARCLFAAAKGRPSLHCITLSVDPGLVDIRRAQLTEAAAQEAEAAARVDEIPEDAYDALTAAEQAAHQKRLHRYRLCAKDLAAAASTLRQLLEARAALTAPPLTVEAIIAQEEEEERQRLEAELTAKKKPDKAKKADVVVAAGPPKTLTPLEEYKAGYSLIHRALSHPPAPPVTLGKAGRTEAAPPPGPPVLDHTLDAAQDPNAVQRAAFALLPQYSAEAPPPEPPTGPDDGAAVPEPFTKQTLMRPGPPREEQPPAGFTVVTPTWQYPQLPPEDEKDKAKPKPKKGAGGKKDEAQEEEKPAPVLIIDETRTRWIIQPGEALNLSLRFLSRRITPRAGVSDVVKFGVVGTLQEYALPVTGICQYPEISDDPRVVFVRRAKNRPEDKFLRKQFVLSSKVFEFGPLLIGKKPDLQKEPPSPASDYCDVFHISNTGMFDAAVAFCIEDERFMAFSVLPRELTLRPGESGELLVVAHPDRLGLITNSVIATIRDNPQPVRFEISCFGTRPEVEVDGAQRDKVIDFDRLLLNVPLTLQSTVTNVSALPVQWKLAGAEKAPPEFTISPKEGTLEPKQSVAVSFSFMATKAVVYNTRLELQVADLGNTRGVAQTIPFTLSAEGFDVCVETTRVVDFGTVKVSQPATQLIHMLNRGKYDLTYEFRLGGRLSEILKVSALDGLLKPKEKVTVEVLFTTKKEITLASNQDMLIRFTEPRTNKSIGAVPVPVSVRAVFSKYLLTPAHGINFGPGLFTTKKTATFEIANQGAFDVPYRLFSLKEGLPADGLLVARETTPAPKKTAKKPLTKKASKEPVVTEFVLGNFVISPSSGVIPVNGSAMISVSLNPEGSQLFHEKLGIHIGDRDPLDSPQGISYELEGESCVPGIHADLETPEGLSIFEEQQIVSRLDPRKNMQAVFARDERVFSFGMVVADGRRVQEKLKLVNPNKVVSVVNVRIRPRGESKDALLSAEAFDVRGYETQHIPPHESRYVMVGFRPQALTTYYATFEAIVDNAIDPKTKELRFELRGDGALPQIAIELPPPPSGWREDPPPATLPPPRAGKEAKRPVSKDGKGAKGAVVPAAPARKLVFPRTIVGEQAASWLRVRNASELPATIRFKLGNGAIFSFPNRNEELVLGPRAVEQYAVYFQPKEVGKADATLTLLVPDNRFEDTMVALHGEGFQDMLTFANVDPGTENGLTLGDCDVGVPKSKAFLLVNHTAGVLRFKIGGPGAAFQVSPAVGHLQPKARKDVTITFNSAEPAEFPAATFTVQYVPIEYTAPDRKGDWDDRHKSVRWVSEAPGTQSSAGPGPEDALSLSRPLSRPEDEEERDRKGGRRGGKDAKDAKKARPGKADREEEERLQREEGERRRQEELARLEEQRQVDPEPNTGTASGPSNRLLRKVVAVDPEPAHREVGAARTKDLVVRCVCAYASWEFGAGTAELPTAGIQFRTTKMFLQRLFSFPFRNTSKVELQYWWAVRAADGAEDPGDMDPNTFTVTPTSGTLAAGAVVNVIVRYAPMDMDAVHRRLLVGHVANLLPDAEQPRIALSGTSECPLVHFQLPASDYLTADRRPPDLQGPGSPLGVIDTSVTQVIEFLSRGIRIRNTKKFYVLNPTALSIEFEWLDQTNDSAVSALFTCHTPRGVIHSGKKFEMVFDFVPETLDLEEALFQFNILGHTSVPFLIVGQAVEPDVYFNTARLNFGSVLIGAKARQEIVIENKEDLPFAFAFDKVMDANLEGQSMVAIRPMAGTVPAQSALPVEVVFSPTTEEAYNYNLVCRVKKKTTSLTCNLKGEGYAVHETMALTAEFDTLLLQPGVPNVLDFGRVHLNDRAIRTIVLANSGRYNFDFKWASPASRFLSVTPAMGSVAKGEKCVMELAFQPTTTCTLDNTLVTCRITNGHQYTLQVSGRGTQPALHFSFTSQDFGPCFLKTAAPAQAVLTIANRDENDIAFDIPWENKPHLEVSAGATVLQKGEKKDVVITFMPKDIATYSEIIPFEINGLYTVPVTVTGEGTVPRVELVNPAQKSLNFGAIRVGEVVKRLVKVTCKSKVTTPFSLANVDLAQYGLSVVPRNTLELKPKEIRTLEFTFAPTVRLRPFTQDVYVEIAGIPTPFLTVSGAGQGIELHLDVKTVSFGPVVHGTFGTKRILLFNTGDVGVRFQWDTRKLEPHFSITPAEGFVQAHNEVALEVVFRPVAAGVAAIVEHVPCRVREDPRCVLELNVNGQCVGRPPVTETLKFQTNVRRSCSKPVKITNPTGSTWNLQPQLDTESWVVRPSILEVKAQETITFDIFYEPTVTTKNRPDGQPEKGTLFLPLPTGEARLYNLEGTADPPVASGDIMRDVRCKTLHTEKVVVNNWLQKPQKFKVTRAFKVEAGILIKGIDEIDVPPQASRDYKFTFISYKDATVPGTITFTNEETKEYLFYSFTFKTLPAATIETITLRTGVRQRAVQDITVENPLPDKPVTLVTRCDSAEVTVAPSLVLPPSGEGRLTVTFFPLIVKPQPTVARLVLSCPELGEFPYALNLITTHAGAEKFIRFQCPLGLSQTQTMRFIHFAKVNADFACKFVEPKPTVFTKTNNQYVIRCTPAAPEGTEVMFDVTFEPSKVGELKETLTVTSPVGGEYTYSLLGVCLPPERQGPVDIKAGGTAQVPFKNVFSENTTFSLLCDNPAFSVNKAVEVVPGKKSVNFVVAFRPLDETYPARGKLLVSCPAPGEGDKKVEWVYYLRGLKVEGKEK
eukprot:EG_transcript_8